MHRDRIDELALEAALNLAASSPRADYTIGQLPSGSPAQTTDNMVIYRSASGRTYQITLAQLATLLQPVVPTASFTQNSFRNKLINGNMEIDQRNNGANITPVNAQYGVDRWKAYLSQVGKFSLQQIALAPSLGVPAAFATRVTSLSSYASLAADFFEVTTNVEANLVQEIAFGTSAASQLTLSFWARASVGGTYAGAIQNAANTRSYPFTFVLPTATFAYVTIPIPGDIAGAWVLTGTASALLVEFDLGSGSNANGVPFTWQAGNFFTAAANTKLVATNAATLDITNVQLEVGSAATPFEQRLYGQELALCQRYCYVAQSGLPFSSINASFGTGFAQSTTQALIVIPIPVSLRANPTLTASAAAGFEIAYLNTATVCSATPAVNTATANAISLLVTIAAGLTAGQGCVLASTGTGTQLVFSADY
jgi:hypothetical protein